MFDRSWILALVGAAALTASCKEPGPLLPTPVPNDVVVQSGPAYFLEPHAGVIELDADARTPLRWALARHRPGLSDLELDGVNLGIDPHPWKLTREALEVPLAGVMVQGLHRIALITSQYPNHPRSAPVVVAVRAATPAKLNFAPQPVIAQPVARILSPGHGTLSGAALAWITAGSPTQAPVLHVRAQASQPGTGVDLAAIDRDLAQASAVALREDPEQRILLAVFADTPSELVVWRWTGQDITSTRLPLPVTAGLDRRVESIAVQAQDLWLNVRQRRAAPTLAYPGDRQVWRVALDDVAAPNLEQVRPESLQRTPFRTDLQVASTMIPVTPERQQAHPSWILDSWQRRTGPGATSPERLWFWTHDTRPPPARRCSTLSPLGDEIWVALDEDGQVSAGTRGRLAAQNRDVEMAPLEIPVPPQGSPSLACSAVQGRFVAALPQSGETLSPMPLLHFDGAQMRVQPLDRPCQDAALTHEDGLHQLWCLHNTELLPITLEWQPLDAQRSAPGP